VLQSANNFSFLGVLLLLTSSLSLGHPVASHNFFANAYNLILFSSLPLDFPKKWSLEKKIGHFFSKRALPFNYSIDQKWIAHMTFLSRFCHFLRLFYYC